MEQYTSVSDNSKFPRLLTYAATNHHVYCLFKTIAEVKEILEHTSKEDGFRYYQEILNHLGGNNIEEIINRAKINDQIGSPNIIDYPFGNISPPTLRYAKVSTDILSIFGNLSNKTICEIGGGYGGQCAVLQNISKCKQYDIVDIPEANMLQRKYLSDLCFEDCNFISCFNLDSLLEEYDIVISNYSFNECIRSFQEVYIDKIISKSKNGYMTVNFGLFYKDEITMEELLLVKPNIQLFHETPLTHPNNIILVWKE